jgi:hypothetical protein
LFRQISVPVHEFPSSQAPFSPTGVPWHTPDLQASFMVQGLLSVQSAPLFPGGLEQIPVSGSHIPAMWQASSGVQTVLSFPVQTPF